MSLTSRFYEKWAVTFTVILVFARSTSAQSDEAELLPKIGEATYHVIKTLLSYADAETYYEESEYRTSPEIQKTTGKKYMRIKMWYERPNRVLVITPEYRLVSDGETQLLHMKALNQYRQLSAPDEFDGKWLAECYDLGLTLPWSLYMLSLLQQVGGAHEGIERERSGFEEIERQVDKLQSQFALAEKQLPEHMRQQLKQRLRQEATKKLTERLGPDWEDKLTEALRPFEMRPDDDRIVRKRQCLAICLPEFRPAPHLGSLLLHLDKENHVLWNVKKRKVGDEKIKWRIYIRVKKVRLGANAKPSRFKVKPPKDAKRVKDFSRS